MCPYATSQGMCKWGKWTPTYHATPVLVGDTEAKLTRFSFPMTNLQEKPVCTCTTCILTLLEMADYMKITDPFSSCHTLKVPFGVHGLKRLWAWAVKFCYYTACILSYHNVYCRNKRYHHVRFFPISCSPRLCLTLFIWQLEWNNKTTKLNSIYTVIHCITHYTTITHTATTFKCCLMCL